MRFRSRSLTPPPSPCPLALAALAGLAAALSWGQPALATWSIILIDTRTREIAVGSATCLSNFDLRNGTPVLIPGVGAATAQSFVDSTGQNRVFIRDRIMAGLHPEQIITQLASFDSGHQTRQYGIADALGRAATFSGTSASAWAGGQVGQFNYTYAGLEGTIHFAIQGNILTGEPVVQEAVNAVMTTEGDLAARMMAGMEAARAMGGDGRCSCNIGPTGCGSPPPNFTKTAHIAYMLIARAGDREGCNGIYRTAAGAIHVAAGDLTGDGRPDLVIANASSHSLSVHENITVGFHEGNAIFPMFGPLPTNYATGAGPRRVVLADVTGDSRLDLVAASATLGSVAVHRALPTGGFASPISYPVGSSPRSVVAADFDGQPGLDLAATNFGGNAISILFNDGTGAFGPVLSVPVEAGPIALAAADLVPGGGGGGIDLAVVCRTANRLVILEGDGAGNFAQVASLPTASGPLALIAGDFNGNQRNDLAVLSDTMQRVEVFLNDGAGGFLSPVSYPLGFTPVDILAGDINGNGDVDLVITGGNRFGVLMNDGAGVFTLVRTYTVAGALSGAVLMDLDGDGDLDLAAANAGVGGLMVVRNDGGIFNDGIGCGTGDYFMNFNIAFQSPSAPDPVFQLQDLYDQWRIDLLGRADAVQSLVSIDPPVLPPDGTSQALMTITLRDWQGQPTTAPIVDVDIVHAFGSDGHSAIGAVAHIGGGIYTVPITAGSEPGLDRFEITIVGDGRPVVLMPKAELPLESRECYANCDGSTTPPILTVDDFTCFINAFADAHGLPVEHQITHYANCDGSTAAPVLSVDDFTCFINAFAQGCP